MHPSTRNVEYITIGFTKVGICFGYDNHRDHEQGIAILAREFGFDPDAGTAADPIEAARNKKMCWSGHLYCQDTGDGCYLMRTAEVWGAAVERRLPRHGYLDREVGLLMESPREHCNELLHAGWSATQFGVRSAGDDAIFFNSLVRALKDENALIALVPRERQYGGLVLIDRAALTSFGDFDFVRGLIEVKPVRY